jgi:hypothetical protein
MSVLPGVREQLQEAAVRASRPERSRVSAITLGAGAVALVAVLAVLLAWTLASPGASVTRAGAAAQTGAFGTLAAAPAASRLQQAAYLQSTSAPALGSVAAPVHARALAQARGGYRVLVSFAVRRELEGPRGQYSAFARGPRDAVLTGAPPSLVAGEAQIGHTLAVRLRTPGAGRLAPGLYRGMVVLTYAVKPALLEDSETVLLPVGSFQVRVP